MRSRTFDAALAILAGMDDKVALLRTVPLFAELDEQHLQAVATLAREVDAKAGDVLMREGGPGDSFLLLAVGTVRIERAGRDVRSLTAGGFMGEISLLEHGPRTATATCVTDCRLLRLGQFEFDRLMATLPDVRTRILAAFERRARTTAT
jgi:CRP/FNR family cyclic AMP-dependent transcriptional regulator